MARPRSEDKRNALLAAATTVVAEQGMGAPTSRIARVAGVAEGTLFTYFDNKDALLNQLYLHLKDGMRQSTVANIPAGGTAEQRTRHAWNGYIAWGLAEPQGHRALRQLGVSHCIDAQHRAAGAEGFGELTALLRDRAATTRLPESEAQAFIGALFSSMAETTLEFIARDPARANAFRDAGFSALWAALGAGSR